MEMATMHFEERVNVEFTPAQGQAMSENPSCANAIIAGSLFGDLHAVARELCRAVQRCPVTAWMNADADVLYQPAHGDVPAIADWIAGTTPPARAPPISRKTCINCGHSAARWE